MTPPDPATPSPLEALLSRVEAAEAREKHLWEVFESHAFAFRQSDAARLADIVLTMRCALTMMIDQIPWVQKSPAAAEGCLSMLKGVLERADEIAEGK